MLDALAEYAAWKKTLNVPHGYVHDDGLRVGAWLTAVRRRRHTGRISVVLEAALDMLSASLAGQGIEKLSWQTEDTAHVAPGVPGAAAVPRPRRHLPHPLPACRIAP